jgi:ribosomal protein S4
MTQFRKFPWTWLGFQNPVNFLYSTDQFFFEFSKKYAHQKKVSEYTLQLQEYRKLRLFYGSLSKKTITRYFRASTKTPGEFSKKFIHLLEQRLDVILYRSHFATTLASARQLIAHHSIFVNHTRVSSPNYHVKPGDIITIDQKSHDHIRRTLKDSLKKLGPFQEFPTRAAVQSNSNQAWIHGFTFWLLNHLRELGFFYFYQTSWVPLVTYKRKELERFRELPKSFRGSLDLPLMYRIVSNKFFTYKPWIKPLNLEISYKVLSIIVLYAPQRVSYPVLIDFDRLKRYFLEI